MSNTNVNNNIAQIVFPNDVEVRKIKKKKRKGNSKKKKAISELKAILKEFDLAVDSAHQNNIDLPEELGTLPTDIEDVNSIKEIQALTENIRSRIQTINQLILESTQSTQANDLFSEGPIYSGVFPALPATPNAVPTTQDDNSSELQARLDLIENAIKKRLEASEAASEKDKQGTPPRVTSSVTPPDNIIPDENTLLVDNAREFTSPSPPHYLSESRRFQWSRSSE